MSDAYTRRSAAVVTTAAKNHFANGAVGPRRKSAPLPIHTNFSNTPVKSTTQDSSNVTGQDKKRMENLLCPSEIPFSATSLHNNSKEVTITPVMNTKNDIMSILKKLPDITFSVIQPEPVFKVSDISTKNNKTPRYVTKNPKVGYKKNILSKKQESSIRKTNVIYVDKYEELKKMISAQKQEQKKVQNNIPLLNNNNIKIISRNTKTASNNNTVSDKENKIRTSSSNKIPEKLPRISQIKLQKQISNNSIVSSVLKTNSNNDSIINNTTNNKDIKTSGSTEGDYKPMDISTKGKIDIVSATTPDLFNISIPKYEDNNTQCTSQSRVDKEPLTRQEFDLFQGFSNDITSMNIFETNNIDFDTPQSHLAEGNVYSNFAENIPEGDSTYCIKPEEEILPNSLCDSSNVKLDNSVCGTKRKQTENELCKKKKIDN